MFRIDSVALLATLTAATRWFQLTVPGCSGDAPAQPRQPSLNSQPHSCRLGPWHAASRPLALSCLQHPHPYRGSLEEVHSNDRTQLVQPLLRT